MTYVLSVYVEALKGRTSNKDANKSNRSSRSGPREFGKASLPSPTPVPDYLEAHSILTIPAFLQTILMTLLFQSAIN